ncbi:hypothetical protein SERLA73DRAFT_164998 [Serpula lacrymans var. lacrymans S7.3]|uniref:Uncharacterized protein n=2 Tax=Serpula lacrymans var. lacrymans TaxID=341189 RepID=F8PJ28_SERL3|nr:uncharacterized protein SERLADRAFT_456266 [Serpula lacrymans var. lacrymans S7.9]EGO03189.1 hypothetical protein SERLA73DRAFT_164998 [Serpula lacrymans var. lacrymans S7.3]EGO28967.1 hypothetical protein SERLADRAFT_456266 [Serpula lacrymans var. lacrymans S7.9]
MALGAIPVTTAQIVALFVECILYGIYLVTLAQCLQGLLWSEPDHAIKNEINWPLLALTVLLCILATADVAFGLRHNLVAFVYYTDQVEHYWVNIMKTVDYAMQTLIGGAIMIYRCYIVYNKNWKIVVPSFVFWLGSLSTGIVVIITFSKLDTSALPKISQTKPSVDIFLSTTLAINIVTTEPFSVLIAYRTWSVDNERTETSDLPTHRVSSLRQVVIIFVESAALYTISAFVFVSTYAANKNSQYVISCGIVPIIGISFNLIIVRVSACQSFEGTIHGSNSLTSVHPGRRRPFTNLAFMNMKSFGTNTQTQDRIYSPKGPPLEVNVLREVDYTRDHDMGHVNDHPNHVNSKRGGGDVT